MINSDKEFGGHITEGNSEIIGKQEWFKLRGNKIRKNSEKIILYYNVPYYTIL